jgi:hypothetical protein
MMVNERNVMSHFLTEPEFNLYLFIPIKYSETSIYRSRMYRFTGSNVQFLRSLSESYLNYGNKTLHQSFLEFSFSRIYWAEFLVLTKVNLGLIVFKKEQHHTQMFVSIGSSNSD